MEVQLPLNGIRDRLRKRQVAIRGWLPAESHPVLVERVRLAHRALGAMIDLLEQIGPRLGDLLAKAESDLKLEQQMRDQFSKEAAANAQTFRKMVEEFRAAGNEAEVEIWEAAAKRNESAAQPVPDLTEGRKSLWNLTALATASSLFTSANYISLSQDIEAMKHMGAKTGATLAKWLLKFSPIRKEDLDDFKDAWDALQAIAKPGKDIKSILESSKMRSAQAKAANSLLNRLDSIADVATEWCRMALAHPVYSIALQLQGATHAQIDAALVSRLEKAALEWQ